MADIRFKVDRDGIAKVMKSAEIGELMQRAGDSVKGFSEGLSESGEARYTVKVNTVGDRVTALVGTDGIVAAYSNAKHKSLAKAIRNARV